MSSTEVKVYAVLTKYGYISALEGNEWTSDAAEAQQYCRNHAWDYATGYALEGASAGISAYDKPQEWVCPACQANRAKSKRGRKKKVE